MTSVQIKGVPEETHAVLRLRAARAHQSLQEYLLGLLVREASTPTVDEVFDRVSNRIGGELRLGLAVQTVMDDRARH